MSTARDVLKTIIRVVDRTREEMVFDKEKNYQEARFKFPNLDVSNPEVRAKALELVDEYFQTKVNHTYVTVTLDQIGNICWLTILAPE